MVSGGAYGTEDIVGGAGFGIGILALLITPLLCSVPTALMIGELATAMPHEGGYYAWVRRAMGNFWGFQEAWLSLAASIFDMAIYPTLFVAYLTRLVPWFEVGHRGMFVALAIVTICALLNIAGIRVVAMTSWWLFLVLSAPFALVVALAPFHHGALTQHAAASTGTEVGLVGAILVAMWNYMGWDNASTVAVEVDRPQRTYPRAMLAGVILVFLSYALPFATMWMTGIPHTAFATGSWADVAGLVGGPLLRFALVLGGMMSAFGVFNALVMSYSRVPLAMAQDGMLPRIFAKTNRTGAPWVSILACAIAWALCLGLGFNRLITIDILLYGMALGLEFVALLVLRIKEPDMPRPYKVPGGIAGVTLLAIEPIALLIFSVMQSQDETILGMKALYFGLIVIALGVLGYGIKSAIRSTGWFVREPQGEEA